MTVTYRVVNNYGMQAPSSLTASLSANVISNVTLTATFDPPPHHFPCNVYVGPTEAESCTIVLVNQQPSSSHDLASLSSNQLPIIVIEYLPPSHDAAGDAGAGFLHLCH